MTHLCGGVDNENQLVRPAKAGTGHARGDVGSRGTPFLNTTDRMLLFGQHVDIMSM